MINFFALSLPLLPSHLSVYLTLLNPFSSPLTPVPTESLPYAYTVRFAELNNFDTSDLSWVLTVGKVLGKRHTWKEICSVRNQSCRKRERREGDGKRGGTCSTCEEKVE